MNEAAVYRLVSERTRRRMLAKLSAQGSATAGELVRAAGRAQPLVSHHLRLLKDAGIVQSKRDGRNVIYSIRGRRMERALDRMDSAAADVARLCR